MQICNGGVYCPDVIDEDCLYLNVFAPFPFNTSSPSPVAVYFHGGSWSNGYSAPFKIFNATNLAANTNTVVVTVNYRLNIFGLLYDDQHSDTLHGNYGVRDIIKSLHWVHDNIVHFGGDNQRVTLFGYSVGSGSAAILMTMEDEEIYSLFQAAILMSNPFFGAPLRTKHDWNRIPSQIRNYTLCDHTDSDVVVQCLQNINASDLYSIAAQVMNEVEYDDEELIFQALRWTPTIDGELIHNQPLLAFRENKFHRTASVMVGSSSDETLGITFGTFQGLDPSYSALRGYVRRILGNDTADAVLEWYGVPENVSDVRYPPFASRITTEGRYICPSYDVIRSIAAHREGVDALSNSVYHLRYNHIGSMVEEISPALWLPYCEEAVCHNSENPILWNPPRNDVVNFTLTEDEVVLSDAMQSHWMRLIETVDGDDVVLWDPFTMDTQRSMVFSNGSSMEMVERLDESVCAVWTQIGYSWLPTLEGQSGSSNDGMDSQDIVLIAGGVIIAIALLGLMVYVARKKWMRSRERQKESTMLLSKWTDELSSH